MAGENRRVAAESAAHAQGLTDNLTRQGFVLESQTTAAWVLRKKRRRGDHVVTISITQPSMLQALRSRQSPSPPPLPQAPSSTPAAHPGSWAPPEV